MDVSEGILYGIFGGFVAQALALFKLRYHDRELLPKWLSSPFYWIITAVMIGSGAGLVFVYMKSNISMSPILAMNIGASAPLILESLASQTPPITPGRID